ncbi:MAG: bacterioferritin [Elusimicrobia bacterium]|nr:bacterioferritin [Elusimicrobiota bacterium]
MKGDAKLLDTLNSLLADELTAVNQYMVHAEVCENWGYGRLHDHFRKRSIDEMKHAEKLISRIIFLEGRPIVGNLREIRIGAEVPSQFANDLSLEMGAVKAYNAAVAQAVAAGDNATRELLESILKDEDRHVDGIEENLDQIQQMGVQNYLAVQVKGS